MRVSFALDSINSINSSDLLVHLLVFDAAASKLVGAD